MACGGRVFEVEVEVVKEEPPDEQLIKAEVDIEEHDLLQHPQVRVALPHLALGGGLPAPAESQVPPEESSVSAGTEAFPDTRQAAPERDNKLEPESLPGEGWNEVTVTEEDPYVAGRWFNSRLVLVDCGAALRHSDRFCAECGRLCSSRRVLRRHQQAHCAPECDDDAPRPPEGAGDKAARRYECDICHYTSETRSLIVYHMRTHTGDKPYKSSVCEYRCNQRSYLSRHTTTAPECDDAPRPPEGAGDKVARRYECDNCHYTSKARTNIVRHLRTHTGEKPYKCIHCEYSCSDSSGFSRHMLTHTGEKPFKCNECEYRCNQMGSLSKHMSTHTGVKPFQCNLCDYRSATSRKLTVHMRTHTGEKPFKCNSCDYRSARSSCLTAHKNTHTGEKPFQCNLCDYRSATSSCLTKHKRTHTGEKPFKCNSCDYRSARSSCLTVHMSTHTGEKPFQCNLCAYRSATSSHLSRHMRTHTKGKACVGK